MKQFFLQDAKKGTFFFLLQLFLYLLLLQVAKSFLDGSNLPKFSVEIFSLVCVPELEADHTIFEHVE
jgi:hypothetical protein